MGHHNINELCRAAADAEVTQVLLNAAETDAARQAAAEDSIRNQRRAQAEERAPDAVAYAQHERAKREQLERELPEHLRGLA